jgi:3-keto-5-aminohexanoate cleavage enzyme
MLSETAARAIGVAPNGGRMTKRDHPALPMTPSELAETAAACREAGAAMIHVHVRDHDGRHLLDAGTYRTALDAIRRRVGEALVLQISSEALGIYKPEQQMAVIREIRPEGVSLALRELAPDAAAESDFSAFLEWLRTERVVPQIILYSPAELLRLDELHRRGFIPFENPPVLFVLGRYSPGQLSDPSDLLPFVDTSMPRFRHWMSCAFGRRETACVTAAALLGGHCRVGFENNLQLPDGTTAPSNAALVAAVSQAMTSCGLRAATADELREAWT